MSNGLMRAAALFLALSVSAAGAEAASLPTFLTMPVQSLAGCGASGQGFEIPGSSTCLRINGEVWSDVTVGHPAFLSASPALPKTFTRATPSSMVSRMHAGAYVSVDARTQTELGPIRAFMSYKAVR